MSVISKSINIAACGSPAMHDIVMTTLRDMSLQVAQIQGLANGHMEDNAYLTHSFMPNEDIPANTKNPLFVASKGRPSNAAIKAAADQPKPTSDRTVRIRQNRCKRCGAFGHYAKSCRKVGLPLS